MIKKNWRIERKRTIIRDLPHNIEAVSLDMHSHGYIDQWFFIKIKDKKKKKGDRYDNFTFVYDCLWA
jgi:hypothetical protein